MPRKKQSKSPSVAEKIRQFRRNKKITLNQVANDTGCSIDYLKKIEAGKVIPPVGTLLQISRALEIDSGFLLKEQESAVDERVKQPVAQFAASHAGAGTIDHTEHGASS